MFHVCYSKQRLFPWAALTGWFYNGDLFCERYERNFLDCSDEFLAFSGMKPSLFGSQMSRRPKVGDVIWKGMVMARVTIFTQCCLSLSTSSVACLSSVHSPSVICDVACRVCRIPSVMGVIKAGICTDDLWATAVSLFHCAVNM